MHVEVVYAKPDRQELMAVDVPVGSTIHQVLKKINFFVRYPEWDVYTISVGIFSKEKKLSDVVRPGDRIEIYRPLMCDPKEARRKKAREPGE